MRSPWVDLTVPELILAQAARTPDAPAALTAAAALSYGELAERAWSFADVLRGRGVGPHQVVGVCLPHSPDLVVALLAVHIAGGAYVHQRPGHWDSIVEVEVGGSGHRPRLLPSGPDSVAFLANGCAVDHRTLSDQVRRLVRRCELGPDDRVLLAASPDSAAFAAELYPALVTGAAVVIGPEAAARHGVTVLVGGAARPDCRGSAVQCGYSRAGARR